MRIITGQYKARKLLTPTWEGTRPMTDRVRESVFGVLGDLTGARVLDLYAGTGAVGIEALSRGASEATFVDLNPESVQLIERNLDRIQVQEPTRILTMDVQQALTQPGRLHPAAYDLVFFTPPYKLFDAALLAHVLPFCAPEASLVVERATRREAPPWPAGLVSWEHRQYGRTEVFFLVPVG